jgi:hypothetical protein
MTPADRDALLNEIQSHAPVELVMRDGDSEEVQPLSSPPDGGHDTFILWNKSLVPNLRRKLITSAQLPHFRVDEFALPVLEMSDSVAMEWYGRRALMQGRIYGQFNGKSTGFLRWFERTARFVRNHWRRSPVTVLSGYLGPETSKWFDSGGLLLPMFLPPPTNEWLEVMDRQHKALK